jgi:hypothetical protein
MTSNNSLPTDWFERKLIPEGFVSKPGDVTETLGEHCTALAFALLGTSDSSATKVLQVYKSTMKQLGVTHYPGNVQSLRRRLGSDHWCNRKVLIDNRYT